VEKLKWIIAAFFLAVIFLLCNLRLVTGKRAPIWDAWAFYGPEFSLIADHARAGHFLLWDPWVNGGTPDHADPTVGAASPIEIPIAAVVGGTRAGFVTYWLLIWFLGPFGLFLFGRYLGAPPWAALVVALGIAFCSFYTGHAEHTSFVYSFSFLPWLIWRFDKTLASRQLWPAVQAGALWGLSALGGYPQLTFLSACFLCLWVVGRFLFPESIETEPRDTRSRPQFGFNLFALVLAFSVGTFVLAPSYAGLFTEGSGYTDRVGPLPKDYAISSNELDPGTLVSFASPYVHLLKYPGLNDTLWPKSNPSVMGNYIGALPLILALLAIIMRPTSGWRLWLLGLALFAMLCAMGDHLPVRGWLYDFVLPTRYFRHSGTFRAYAIFAAAVLAIAGSKDLQLGLAGRFPRIWKRLAIISFTVAIAAIFSYHHIISQGLRLAENFQRANHQVVLVWAGSCLIFLVLLMWPQMRRATPILLCLLAITDVFYTARISQPLVSDAGFFGPLWTRTDANHKTHLALSSLERNLTPPSWLPQVPNDANIPLKTATLFNDATMANHFHIDLAKHALLSAMASGSNRIWFADTTATVTPSDATYDQFVKRVNAIGAPVVVLHPPKEMIRVRPENARSATLADAQTISQLPPAHQAPTDLIAYAPNQLKFNVQCRSDGWLLVTDRWSAGWRATVNDLSVPVFGSDFIFRAIPVRAGNNRVEFSYRPFAWWELILLSWSTLLVVFAGPSIKRFQITCCLVNRLRGEFELSRCNQLTPPESPCEGPHTKALEKRHKRNKT
jgi:hypothetical protein